MPILRLPQSIHGEIGGKRDDVNGEGRAGKPEFVEAELRKMHGHLLVPLGVKGVPARIADAVSVYTAARAEAEKRLAMTVPRVVEDEVRRLLSAGGYAI